MTYNKNDNRRMTRSTAMRWTLPARNKYCNNAYVIHDVDKCVERRYTSGQLANTFCVIQMDR